MTLDSCLDTLLNQGHTGSEPWGKAEGRLSNPASYRRPGVQGEWRSSAVRDMVVLKYWSEKQNKDQTKQPKKPKLPQQNCAYQAVTFRRPD